MARQRYTIGQKKKIAREAKKATVRAVAIKYNVDRRCIRDWVAQDNAGSFDAESPGSYRLGGGGRRITCEELDSLLITEIREARRKHRRVTRRRVVEMAAKIIRTMAEQPNLTLSNGWLECFLRRHNLVLRKTTNKPKLSPEVIATRGANFILRLRKIVRDYKIEPKNVVNLDETAVFAEHDKDTTLEERGATDVPVKSFGFEKIRLTAVFAVRGDGTKMMPCVLDKGKDGKITTEQGIPVITNAKSWMDSDAFIRYIDYMFPFPEPNKTLLVFDSAPSHISKKVKAHLKMRKILFAVIPGGLTSYLQPCDYGVFKPLKERLADSIDDWKEHGPHSFTAGGNVRPPSLSTAVGWIKAAWSEIGEPSIRRSFRSCFLGENADLALWRHEEYGHHFQRLVFGSDVADSLSQLLLVDDGDGSGMDIDDDEYEIDFSNAPAAEV